MLELLADLDAHLAGLEVGFSEANATATQELVAELERSLEADRETLVALCEAVEDLVEAEDPEMVARAKEHADELRRQVEAEDGGE